MGGSSGNNVQVPVTNPNQNLGGGMGGLDLLGGFGSEQVSKPPVNNNFINNNQGDLLGNGDLLGGNIPINNNPPQQQIFNQPPQ